VISARVCGEWAGVVDKQRREWGSASPAAAEVQRGVYGKVTLRF
jgi:hypothetical protein